jgi:Flp pilus assembly protein TadG
VISFVAANFWILFAIVATVNCNTIYLCRKRIREAPGGTPMMNATLSSVKKRSVRRGVAAVELALFLPPLVLIAFGCVDFGRFAYTYISVTSAAGSAASYAAQNPYSTWGTGVRQAAVNEMQGSNGSGQGAVAGGGSKGSGHFTSSSLTVSTPVVTPSSQGDGRWSVSVTVSYPFKTVVPYPGIPKSMTLTRTAVMPGVGYVP